MEPSRFDQAEFAQTMARIAEGDSHGDTPTRPGFDFVQHQEVVAEAMQGRRIEDYKKCLETFGFKFYPAGSIPPGCEASNPLEPPRPIVESQWRRPADVKIRRRLAMTEAQVVSWFSTPQELWQWLKDMSTADRMQAERRKVPETSAAPVKIYSR